MIQGGTFELTPNAQLWPRSLNSLIGGTAGTIYLIVGDIGTNSGSGLDFINGQTFLERFYVVLDTANKRVGLANTTKKKIYSCHRRINRSFCLFFKFWDWSVTV